MLVRDGQVEYILADGRYLEFERCDEALRTTSNSKANKELESFAYSVSHDHARCAPIAVSQPRLANIDLLGSRGHYLSRISKYAPYGELIDDLFRRRAFPVEMQQDGNLSGLAREVDMNCAQEPNGKSCLMWRTA
jgi:hypothetical protein